MNVLLHESPCFGQAGDLDPTFGEGGIVITDLKTMGYSSAYSNIIVQPDGKILVGGGSHAGGVLARYNLDGSLDATFGVDGIVLSNVKLFFPDTTEYYYGGGGGFAIALQSDGKIVSGGVARSKSGNTEFVLIRYHADGSADTSFGTNGMVITDLASGSWDRLHDIAVQDDGRIVAVGSTATAVEPSVTNFALVRYHPNGRQDHSFGSIGLVTTDFGFEDCVAKAVVLQPDGKIVVAGEARDGGYYVALARYCPDGSLDITFGTGGLVITAEPLYWSYIFANDVELQSDGKIVIAGKNGWDVGLFRYNCDGSLDATFGIDGKVITEFGSSSCAYSLALQPDGKIVAAGAARVSIGNDWGNNFILARYNNDGTLDISFGTDGKVETVVGESADGGLPSARVEAVAIRDSGEIVAAGYAHSQQFGQSFAVFENIALAQYASDGSLDLGFGINGTILTEIPTHMNSNPQDVVVIQGDGKIVVAGYGDGLTHLGYSDFMLARYNRDGSLDTSYGNGGIVITDIGAYPPQHVFTNDFITAIVQQEDGKIVAVGYSIQPGYNYTIDFALARYNSDGTLDTTFGEGGIVITEFPGPRPTWQRAYALDAAIQPDGKVVALGYAWTKEIGPPREFALARYNTDGTLDTTFGNGGKLTTDIDPAHNDFAWAIALQPDGKIIAVGNSMINPFEYNLALARYNPDGGLDTTFGTGGIVSIDAGPSYLNYIKAESVVLQPDGKIVTAGQIGFLDGGINFGLARINPDGSLDMTFGYNGFVSTDFAELPFPPPSGAWITTEFVRDIALQADGRIIVVGGTPRVIYDVGHRPVGSHYDFALARYNSDGSLDYNFGDGGRVTTDIGIGDVAEAVTLQADGKILLVGDTLKFLGYRHFGPVEYWTIVLARYEGISTKLDELEGLVYWTQDLAASGVLNDGQARSCQAKLLATIQLVDGGKNEAAIRQLMSFLRKMNAFVRSGILSEDQWQFLKNQALVIIEWLNQN
jgi:uncharacterized delta-60 repeat protein